MVVVRRGHRSDCIGRRPVYKNWSTNSEKLLAGHFSCVKINVFRSFFAFRLEMHVSCDYQYKTGADRGHIVGQPRLFECMGIFVLSPAHESEMRGDLVYVPVSYTHLTLPTRRTV